MADREIDYEYLDRLERKLQQLKNPNRVFKSKDVLQEITKNREDRLFNLLTAKEPNSIGFEDSFVDVPITASYLQRKIAPQTVAVNKQELLKLVKNDLLECITKAVVEEETKGETGKEEVQPDKPTNTTENNSAVPSALSSFKKLKVD